MMPSCCCVSKGNTHNGHCYHRTCTYESSPKPKAYKNLLAVAVSFALVNGAHIAVSSLQSSLNEQDGLGLISLIVIYSCFIVSVIYTSATVNLIGSKYTILFTYVSFMIYILMNFYPHWYTIIPGSVVVGLSLGPSWASQIGHITTAARHYASHLNKNSFYFISLFNGVHTLVLKLGHVIGNLASSVVFFASNAANISHGEPFIETSLGEICNNTEAATVDKLYVYILLSIFVVFDIVAIVICITLIDNFGTNCKLQSLGKMVYLQIKVPLLETMKMFLNWKILMILPMITLDTFVLSFSLGEFTKYYVSDCIGVHWIGVSQIVFSIFSGISALVNGHIVKWIPQYIIVYVIAVLNVAVVLFLLLWERIPNFTAVFVVIFIWGICGGIWHAVPFSLAGALFKDKQETALAVVTIGFAFGFVIGYSGSQFLHIEVQLYIALFIILISSIGYSVLVFKIHTKEELFPCACCFKNENGVVTGEQDENKNSTQI